MAIFYISIYLIIIILLIDVVRFCLKMSLSGDWCRTEICQAHQLPCVCVMGVFTEWHYQTGNRSKILLLFNLFLNILNIFEVLGDCKFTNVCYLLQNWCQSMMWFFFMRKALSSWSFQVMSGNCIKIKWVARAYSRPILCSTIKCNISNTDLFLSTIGLPTVLKIVKTKKPYHSKHEWLKITVSSIISGYCFVFNMKSHTFIQIFFGS